MTRLAPESAPEGVRTWLVLALAGLFTLLLLVDPILRMPVRFEVNYNEGWNLYHSAEVLAGRSPYANPGGLVPTNYPPVFFLILGVAGRLAGDPLLIGRALSFVSLLLVGLGVGVALATLGCSRFGAALGCLTCLALFASRARDYVGMNDPQILGQVFSFGTLLLYLRGNGNRRSLPGIAALAIAGLSLKHSLVAVPITIVLDAFRRSPRRGLALATHLGLLGGAVLFFLYALYGAESLAQILASRNVSLARLGEPEIRWHALWSSLGVVTALFGLAWVRRGHPRVVELYLLVALSTGLVSLCAAGTHVNMLFDVFLALSLATGLIADSLRRDLHPQLNPSHLARLLALMVLVGAIATELPHVRLWDLDGHLSREAQFAGNVSFLASRPGPALCESLLLCYFAGKALEYDPFLVGQMLATATIPERVVLSKLEQRYFVTVQLAGEITAPYGAEPLWRRERFSNVWMEQLSRYYEVARVTDRAAFFIARQESLP